MEDFFKLMHSGNVLEKPLHSRRPCINISKNFQRYLRDLYGVTWGIKNII